METKMELTNELIWTLSLGPIVIFLTFLLVYSLQIGLFTFPTIKEKLSPDITAFYKLYTGPYNKSSEKFQVTADEVEKLNLKNKSTKESKSFAVYLDDPKILEGDKLRYAVGFVTKMGKYKVTMTKNDEKVLKELGYKRIEIPEGVPCKYTTFPFAGWLSVILAVRRVYPKIYEVSPAEEVQTTVPCFEICTVDNATKSCETEYFLPKNVRTREKEKLFWLDQLNTADYAASLENKKQK